MNHFLNRFSFAIVCVLGFASLILVNDHDQIPQTLSLENQNLLSRGVAAAPVSEETDLYTYDLSNSELSQIPDKDLLDFVTVDDEDWSKSTKPSDQYVLSPAQLEDYESLVFASSNGQPEYDFTNIAGGSALVDYEDEKICAKKNRLNQENAIKKTLLGTDKKLAEVKVLQNLLKERPKDSPALPKACVTHVMNSFNIGPRFLARCASANGPAARNGTKPCVTKNLVNLTYNSFVDVTECFNVNPKELLPKLSNESGMTVNTLGAGFDAGVGQLTSIAIKETNKYYANYIDEAKKSNKPACQRLMQSELFLNKVSDSQSQRCSLISLPENPLKNMVYMAIYNRINLDYFRGVKYEAGLDYINKSDGQKIELSRATASDFGGALASNKIYEMFKKLKYPNVNMNEVATMMAFAGYNAGPQTALNMLIRYLDKRIKAGKPLANKDFDFYNIATAKDIDGKEKKVTEIASLFIRAASIKKNDAQANAKVQRVKLLPEKIRTSHLLTFPEFIIYNQNNFYDSILNPANAAKVNAIAEVADKAKERTKYEKFSVIGAPGYLNFLAIKDKANRNAFEASSGGTFYCSDPQFLNINKDN